MDVETQTCVGKMGQENTEISKILKIEEQVNELSSHTKCAGKDRRKGKPIPGFAREVILKVAALCEQEAKNNFSKYPLNAPTKRAAMYTGVSERTVQRIRNEDRKKKISANEKESVNDNKKSVVIRDHPDEESNYNTMKRKSKRGQTIPNSARDVISKVVDACDREHRDGEYMVPFICKSKRTALYTGVSQRTVQRIKNEDEKRNKVNQEKILLTPGKKRKRSTFNDKIDDLHFYSIRRLIDDLLLVKKVSPTCTALHTAVKERITFPYSEDTLYRLLHSKGFIWHKVPKGKRVLLEKPEFFRSRLDYLQIIKVHEKQGKFIIYLDETWNGRNNEDSYFDNKGIFGIKGGICCSGRLMILHEYSAMGFIRRAERLFKPNIVESDTKPDISTVDKWMKENLFPNIPANSVIVISTNTYKKEDNIPNEYSSKPTLVEFLKEKNLKYNSEQTCSDLYGTIKNYLAKLPNEWNEIVKIMENYGHTVLRLPSHMSEFNPIELAWTDIKRYVRDKNPTGKISPKLVKEITLQAIEYLQSETLQGYVNHVLQMEHYFWDKHALIQEHFDNVTKSSTRDVKGSNSNTANITTSTSATANSTNNNSNLISLSNVPVSTNISMPLINPTLPVNSISSNHARHNIALNSCALLPPNQLGYVRNVATPVLGKSAVVFENHCLDGGLVQAGPSYLNL